MKKLAVIISLLFAGQINAGFAQTKIGTNNVLVAYYSVKNALASDDNVLAAKNATLLAKQIAAVKTDKFSNPEKEVWIKESLAVKSAATSIAANTDIAKQRRLFGTLSNSMIAIAKNVKLGQDTVFVQYCPMVKESWLNENKEIENPYYGKSMFECGTVKEVLNDK